MPRRIRLGSTTGDALQSLDAQLGTGNENGNNPDNDLVARDSNGNIVLRYDESAGAWTLEGVDLDAGGNDISNVGSVNTESANIDELGSGAFATSDQTIPSGSLTKVEFDSVLYDDEGELDLSNNRMVVNESGRYSLEGRAMLRNPGSVVEYKCRIRVNGSDVDLDQRETSSSTISLTCSKTVELAAGDVVELYVNQDTGGTIDTVSGENTVFLTINKEG